MPGYVGIVLGVMGLSAGLLVVFHLVGRRFRASLGRTVAERIEPGKIPRKDLWVEYFGRKRKGLVQLRGNGALVLTDSRLWFYQAVPGTETAIPLGSVMRVSTSMSHLSKTIFRPLLLVEFDCGEGPDSAAWAVSDTEGWMRDVETARGSVAAPEP